jgi:type II secretory ATPase GspE/PulE/Tfp pilus assembly ATPase PilB-like protein
MESNITQCKICSQLKKRTLVSKYDNRNKRYDDDAGKAWRGLVCPSCHKEDIRKRMQAMRVLRKSLKEDVSNS